MTKHLWFLCCMSVNQDRLLLLKNKYAAEIAATESRLRELRGKLSLIDELESDAEGLSPAPNGSLLKYADGKTKLTDAILETVKGAGAKGISASKVAQILKENGFRPGSDNFVVTVGTTLRRLAGRNEIKTELRSGDRLYMPQENVFSDFK